MRKKTERKRERRKENHLLDPLQRAAFGQPGPEVSLPRSSSPAVAGVRAALHPQHLEAAGLGKQGLAKATCKLGGNSRSIKVDLDEHAGRDPLDNVGADLSSPLCDRW